MTTLTLDELAMQCQLHGLAFDVQYSPGHPVTYLDDNGVVVTSAGSYAISINHGAQVNSDFESRRYATLPAAILAGYVLLDYMLKNSVPYQTKDPPKVVLPVDG